MTDEELTARAAAAWEKHNAGPRLTGGPDYGRREFMAGYRAGYRAAATVVGTCGICGATEALHESGFACQDIEACSRRMTGSI